MGWCKLVSDTPVSVLEYVFPTQFDLITNIHGWMENETFKAL